MTYTQTFMEKLLGKNYKWWYLMIFQLKSRTSSFFDSALFVTGQLLIVVSTITIWWLAGGKVVDNPFRERVVYFIVGELFFAFIFNFAEFTAFEIIRGQHISKLLRPQNFFKITFFDLYGQALLQNIVKITILLCALILIIISGITTISFINSVIFLMLPTGLVILFLIKFLVGCSGFFLSRIHGDAMNFTFLSSLLMGRSFPLDLLIPNFWINLLNPFAFTFYHPMQVYLGNYSLNQVLFTILSGIIWSFVLYLVAKFTLKAGLKRNEAIGL